MKVGIKGISYSATERRYLVRVVQDSNRIYLGRFHSLEEAQAALRAYEEAPAQEQENTPVLNSIRAQFASKKSNNKSKKVSVAKPTPKPDVFVLSNPSKKTSSKVKEKKPEVLSKVLKNEDLVATIGDLRITAQGIDQASYDRRVANQTLELLLKRLLEMAEERGTSVFDVIVQEVARLSKK